MKYDYIVVGSGIAGLYSAYQLHKKGFKVLILEKNEDPGGRMRSKKIHSDYENIGASFISSAYTHLIALAKELNLKLTKNDGILNNLVIIDENNNLNPLSPNVWDILKFNKVPLKQKLKFVLEAPLFVFEALYHVVPNFNKLKNYDDESVKDYVSRTMGKEFSKYFLEPAVWNLFSYGADDFSKAMALGVFKFLLKGRKYYNFKKGLEELPIKISQKVETVFNCDVSKIKRNPIGVIVTTKDGKEFEAEHVVVAIPGKHVLDIIEHPNQSEKEFFPKVRYSSHIKVFCETTDELICKYDRIVFAGDSNIASTNITHRHKDYTTFSFGISDSAAKKLIEENRLSNDELKDFINNNLNFKVDFKVIKPIVWESALPMYYPGYIKAAYKFKKVNVKENPIVYVGDYLSGPFLEGAILSSVEVFGWN